MEMHMLAVLLILLVLTGEERDSLFIRPAVLAKSLPVLRRNTATKRKLISGKLSQEYPGYSRHYHYGDRNISSNTSPYESKLEDVKRRVAQHTWSANGHVRILPRTKTFQNGNETRSDPRVGAIEARAMNPQVRKRHHIIARNGVQAEVIKSRPPVHVGGNQRVKSYGFLKGRNRPNRKSKSHQVKAFHHFQKISLNRSEEGHRKRTPSYDEAVAVKRESVMQDEKLISEKEERKDVKRVLLIVLVVCAVLVSILLFWICRKYNLLPDSICCKWLRRGRGNKYTLIPDSEEQYSKSKRRMSKDSKQREVRNAEHSTKALGKNEYSGGKLNVPTLTEQLASSSQESTECYTNSTALNGKNEYAKVQTLSPVYMGRYNIMQSSSEELRSPVDLRSGTESDESSISATKYSWPTQIANFISKRFSNKLTGKDIQMSHVEESQNLNSAGFQCTLTEVVAGNADSRPLQIEMPSKSEAIQQHSNCEERYDSSKPCNRDPYEVCKGVRECDKENFHGSDENMPLTKKPVQHTGKRYSSEVEAGRPKWSRRKRRHSKIRSHNQDVLLTHRNMSYKSSDSDSASDEAKSVEFKKLWGKVLMQTKPFRIQKRESEAERSQTKTEANKGGKADDFASVAMKYAKFAKRLSSTSADRRNPNKLRQSEVTTSNEEVNTIDSASIANSQSSSSDCSDTKVARKKKFRKKVNSWRRKRFGKRSKSKDQAFLSVWENGRALSYSTSSVSKSDNPEFCKSIWTPNEFSRENKDRNVVSNSSSTIEPYTFSRVVIDCVAKQSRKEGGGKVFKVPLKDENPTCQSIVDETSKSRPLDVEGATASLTSNMNNGTEELSRVYGTDYSGTQTDGIYKWQCTSNDPQRVHGDSGINSSPRSTASSSHISSSNRRKPGESSYLEGRRILSDNSIDTMNKRKKGWRFVKRIFRSKKSLTTINIERSSSMKRKSSGSSRDTVKSKP